ncbi:flagellar biosynthetic protein FliO [Lachnospiraceae bacterium OttesenSCG-928-J05]|nr:flagellar biosynthetic protein FliO [Lachnospiraceae bacterium OttesenSCG-928-J05]
MFKEIITAVGTLLLVCAFLYFVWFCTRSLTKIGNIRGGGKYMKQIEQLPIGQDRSLIIVQVKAGYLLLGVSASGITVLEKMDTIEELPFSAKEMETPDFKKLMDKIVMRKK